MQCVLYASRECSTNQTFFEKQTQFFPVFQPKTTIPQKNKPNTNPIQTQYKANQTQFSVIIKGTKPIQSQNKPILSAVFWLLYSIMDIVLCRHMFKKYNMLISRMNFIIHLVLRRNNETANQASDIGIIANRKM